MTNIARVVGTPLLRSVVRAPLSGLHDLLEYKVPTYNYCGWSMLPAAGQDKEVLQ